MKNKVENMCTNTLWEVYIIQAKSGALYTGITTDLDRRLADHERGKKGARFFRISQPEKIVFREMHPTRSDASKREAEIKKMSRLKKLELISHGHQEKI